MFILTLDYAVHLREKNEFLFLKFTCNVRTHTLIWLKKYQVIIFQGFRISQCEPNLMRCRNCGREKGEREREKGKLFVRVEN